MRAIRTPAHVAILCLCSTSLFQVDSVALDTIEPYTPGATDYEFSLGSNGLGADNPTIFADTLLAFGIKPWLGLETQFIMETDARLQNANGTIASALLFSPLDTEHFDLDVVTGFLINGDGFNEARLNGLLEFNIDSDDDLSFLGVYFRVGVELYNDRASDPTRDEAIEFLFPAEVGGYWSPIDGQQLLLEYAASLNAELPSPNDVFNHGRIAVGYNVLFSEDFELVTQLSLNLPQQQSETSASILIGFIKVWDGRVNPPRDAQ